MDETYYLIDFENVGPKGLEGAGKLTTADQVHLFSTSQAAKITTATLANFNATKLLVHEVPAGSQSVDMHLVSFLGYLLGSRSSAPQIVIVSNDSDYDDIVSFWKSEKGVVIQRRDKLVAEEAKPAPAKSAGGGKTTSAKKASPSAKPQADVSEKPAGKAKKSAKTRTKADEAQKKAAKAGAKTAEYPDKTTLNNAVLKTLSNAKYDNETVSFAASLVTKNFAEKGGKQTIYRTVISKFGQERGLAIYRHIQKLL